MDIKKSTETKTESNELDIRDVFVYFNRFRLFLKKYILIFISFGSLGGVCGLLVSSFSPKIYVAKLTFAVEDEKNSSNALGGALGLASTLGFDIGGGGGVFSGSNLIELMQSRLMTEKALLSPVNFYMKNTSLADYYIEFRFPESIRKKIANINFRVGQNREDFTFQQDSLLGVLCLEIAGENGILKVLQKDKKVNIITVQTKSKDEIFAKLYTENLVKQVSDFYIETKSKKARNNYEILQRQTDSIRRELNLAISGVANNNENTFNLNSALMKPRTSGVRSQVDIQANTAILTQLVTNLELAKVNLRKETPLIQVIDKPILPLLFDKIRKKVAIPLGFFLGIAVSLIVVYIKKNRRL